MQNPLTVYLFIFFTAKAQLYNPGDNASVAIDSLLRQSKKTGKHVFLQIGGNWCSWCLRFNDFIKSNGQIDSLIQSNYVVYHLNYSSENYNKEILKKLEFPQRFGFPVFVILDSDGKRLHTQNSAYLEEGKSYSAEKVKEFLINWCPDSLQPFQYK